MSTQLATLPPAALARQVEPAQWNALKEIYDGASDEKVALVIDYCAARKLDPLKKPVHIVQTWSAKRNCMVETIWPAISEVRITAMRTGNFVGQDETKFGPTITQRVGVLELSFPEWAQVTVHRSVKVGAEIRVMPFVGPKTFWLECYSSKGKDPSPNAMWAKRTWGQLEKCAEAAALRRAFPEELGSQYTAEEMHGRTIDDADDDNATTATQTTERKDPPARTRRGGVADAKKAEAAAGATSDATTSTAAPKDSKFTGPTTEAEIVDEAQGDAGSAEREAAFKAEEERKAALAASEKAKAAAEAAAKAAADKARADAAITSPEVLPGVSFEGYHGKNWDNATLSGTVKTVALAIAPSATAPKAYAKLEVDTGREILPITTFEGVQIVDGKAMATLTALAAGGFISFVVKPKFHQAKDPATKKAIPGSSDRTRAPLLMAENVTEGVGDDIPV